MDLASGVWQVMGAFSPRGAGPDDLLAADGGQDPSDGQPVHRRPERVMIPFRHHSPGGPQQVRGPKKDQPADAQDCEAAEKQVLCGDSSGKCGRLIEFSSLNNLLIITNRHLGHEEERGFAALNVF